MTKKFDELGLNDEFLKVLRNLKFEKPTEIQEKTIPLALAGKDIIGESATGSGKTLAFGASIIEKVQRNKGIQALILTPTRELAEQVGKNLNLFSSYKDLFIATIYGGVGMPNQIEDLTTSEIVVGTPGRILDHINRGTINLKGVKYLVLDEADRMLDMGFIEDVKDIIESVPEERQTFLFSATLSPDIERIGRRYMQDYTIVSAESYVDPSKLKQYYYDTPQDMKFSLLVHLLKEEKEGLVMVFCNTRRNVDFVAKNLRRYDIDSLAIHGGLTQNKRTNIMEKFHSGRALILICTDVAARGLDIKNVSHVYNYDIPMNSKEYIHRIGRTARAGTEGKAISLVSPRDHDNFRNVLQDDSLKIEEIEVPEVEQLRVQFQTDDRGGFRGGRGGSGGGGRDARRGGRGYGSRSGGRSFGRRY